MRASDIKIAQSPIRTNTKSSYSTSCCNIIVIRALLVITIIVGMPAKVHGFAGRHASMFVQRRDPLTCFEIAASSQSVRGNACSCSHGAQMLPLYSTADGSTGDVGSTDPTNNNNMNDAARTSSAQSTSPAPLTPPNALINQLRKLSNVASILCVLDCTILPIITVVLPLLGFLQLSPARLDSIHHLGHQLALYFVLPVGSLTSTVNYISHGKKWILSLGIVGLCVVGLANSHIHALPIVGHVRWLHAIQCGGWMHRLVNISGCAMLLSSNYMSQRQGCAFHTDCSHDHSHDAPDHGQASCNHKHR
uniref:MerC domain-containing protein n=1 Tax=Craspedostauros australis TaxID=1486917 RepID=A0A7R9WSU2_9STRA|mmetsp:Transcript_1598/g.4364  ORF Transcript_1598/g.4364 Transcript_1598/m.4364 type:complete len:306 (+) Transcript_1598:149-1066(+)